ncbi:MAG TPA: glycoside hydrolase family 15 protein [Rhizobiaceae bacterium]|nr:glycoside hydrolase family 15 protein [Rhizobiaceae bacterium]
MKKPIEDYGFIGNRMTGALVGCDGSIDWLCLPRFDSDACFAALVGAEEHGRWKIAPKNEVKACTRRYLPGTAVLETTFETVEGRVSLTDFMPFKPDGGTVELVRIVHGISGKVPMEMDFILRFGYGRTIPWVRRRDYGLSAVSGPDAVELVTRARLEGKDMKTVASFEVEAGRSIPFTLAYHASHDTPAFVDDHRVVLRGTVDTWRGWSGRCELSEEAPQKWKDAVERSLITLKSLTYRPTGAIIAAPTTSLPEEIGGERNWDYRFCWIRDATLTLYALVNSGFFDEADKFRQWLLRAAAGDPSQMQIMYGLAGERRLTEMELDWLPGYMGSRPVRIGNLAHEQLQLDVYGELMDAFHAARRSRLGSHRSAWKFQGVLLKNLQKLWHQPDEGIWEVRGGPRHFTFSKMMSWVAFDRGINAAEKFGLEGPVDEWRRVRQEIHAEICEKGFDRKRNTFVQSYGDSNLDASLLLTAETGFLKTEDPRFRGTVEAIEKTLLQDGFVLRYQPKTSEDGLSGGEGAFLACSFWLVNAYAALGRRDDAEELFDRLLDIRNDLGLLAEEYDPKERRQLGNFPQAFSHVGLVNAAHNLMRAEYGPSEQRAGRTEPPHSDENPTEEHV